MTQITRYFCVLLFLSQTTLHSQTPEWSSSEIFHEIEKLGRLPRVLYVAAHPDDENTRLITWLANDAKVEVAYVSLTRGDGGQNLIGPELGSELGVIRTQELLQARKIDGGIQYFTRAVDFGYSKSAEETFEQWGKEEMLRDMVYIIRHFKPDVIINRFPPDSRGGHGHHTASAMLSIEAFDMAGNKEVFPDQLEYVDVWSPTRLYWNASSWWMRELRDITQTNAEYVVLDIGQYSPVLGRSMGDIGGESRSQHRSQGFGAERSRGQMPEHLQFVKGKPHTTGLFDDIAWNWQDVGQKKLSKLHGQIVKEFDFKAPHKSIPKLLEFRKLMLQSGYARTDIKLKRGDQIIMACAGFWMDWTTSVLGGATGEEVSTVLRMIKRTEANVQITAMWQNKASSFIFPISNLLLTDTFNIQLPEKPSSPYWLEGEYGTLFSIPSPDFTGKPDREDDLRMNVVLNIEGVDLRFLLPLRFRKVDRVLGDIAEPFVVKPALELWFEKGTYLFPSPDSAYHVSVFVRNNSKEDKTFDLNLYIPRSWILMNSYMQQTLAAGRSAEYKFIVKPGGVTTTHTAVAEINIGGHVYDSYQKTIAYEHIPHQTINYKAQSKWMFDDVRVDVKRVAYIIGAGDDIPLALENLGLSVTYLNESNLASADLSQFEVIITGIRAYNNQLWLLDEYHRLMEYVEKGGHLIVQYVTRDVNLAKMAPEGFVLGRGRVTDEHSPMGMLQAEHPVFNFPNKIAESDFDGWVQERGIYFMDKWPEGAQVPISFTDPGEEPQSGSLVMYPLGKGCFTYTGIAFFRQLPEGVPGAYKLFSNLISFKP